MIKTPSTPNTMQALAAKDGEGNDSSATVADQAKAKRVKIIIIAPAWLGDAIMSHCLIKCLAKRYPGCRLDVLAPPSTAQIYKRMLEVNKVYTSSLERNKLQLWQRRRLGKKLKAGGYTHAVVLPNSWKSALITFWAGIPKRIGWLGEQRYGLLTHHAKLNVSSHPLMVQRFVALCFDDFRCIKRAKIPNPKLQVDTDNQRQALTKFELNLDHPVVALCPGAAFGPAKQWPSEYWVKTAKFLLQHGYSVWLMGAPTDQTICATINTRIDDQAINLAGKTSLLELIDLLAVTELVISNDSGAMHIAAALGKQQIAFFGSTSPDFTPPLNSKAVIFSRDDLDCKPCFERTCPLVHLNCLRGISPEQVTTAIAKLLQVGQ